MRFVEAVNYLLSNNIVLNKAAICDTLKIKASKFSEILNYRMNVGTDLAAMLSEYYDIDANWLLTGRGSMLKSEGVALMNDKEQPVTSPNLSAQPVDEALLYTMYKEKEAKIEAQAEQIGSLKQQIKTLEEKIEGLQHHAHVEATFAGSARTRKNDAADLGDVRFAEQL